MMRRAFIAGFAYTLKKNDVVGWNDFPIDAYRWAHGDKSEDCRYSQDPVNGQAINIPCGN